MTDSLISVVVPAYNAAPFIAECLDSILAQDVPGLDVLVVDDGSTDDTAKIVRGYKDAVRYVHQPNSGGCSGPRNVGAGMCRSRFIAFFDADDVMLPNKLAAQIDYLERHADDALVLSDYRNFDFSGDFDQTHFEVCREMLAASGLRPGTGEVSLSAGAANRLLLAENFGIASSPVFRKAVIDTGFAFDAEIDASADFDLIYRVAREHSIGLIGSLGFRRRLHENNMTRHVVKMLEQKIRSREKLLAGETNPDVTRMGRRSLATFEADLACALTPMDRRAAIRHWTKALAWNPGVAASEWRILARVFFPRRDVRLSRAGERP